MNFSKVTYEHHNVLLSNFLLLLSIFRHECTDSAARNLLVFCSQIIYDKPNKPPQGIHLVTAFRRSIGSSSGHMQCVLFKGVPDQYTFIQPLCPLESKLLVQKPVSSQDDHMIIPMAVRGNLLEIVASIDRRKVVNIRSSLIYCKWSVSRCLLKCLHHRCCSDSIRPLVMALLIASMIRHYSTTPLQFDEWRLWLKIIDEKDDIPMGIRGAEAPRTTNRLAAVVHKRNFMI